MTTATVNFSETEDGLFTPEEIRSLMRVEYDRARRYRYPASILLIAVDRLESLQDLYGWESKEEILSAVIQALRATTRDSDFLGCMHDGRILVVFPHTDERAITAIATRLLRLCRTLDFRTDGRAIRATVSIGAAVLEEGDEREFDELVAVAEEAVTFALTCGGDRFVLREEAESVIERLRGDLDAEAQRLSAKHPDRLAPKGSTPTAQPQSEAPRAIPGARPVENTELARQLASVFASLAPGEDLRGVEREVLALTEEFLARERDEAVRRALDERANEVDLLERRVRKLKGLLDETSEELRRIATMKGIDSGIASIYRTVQGLAPDESRREEKREMLTLIFEANLELQKKKRRS